MPKGTIKKIDVNKLIFMSVLKKRGYSIRKICSLYDNNHQNLCSDRTLRRSLDSGKIRFKYVDEIAKIIDVDPRYLTGEIETINPKLSRLKNTNIPFYLSLINEYPYSRKKLDELKQTAIKDHITNLLSLFDFSYNQFEALDFETQYNFQHELFEAMIPVLARYFKKDGYGNTERPALNTLLYELECYYENECELRHADTIVRQNFIQSPPQNYSVEEIKCMSREELRDLNMLLQWS